MGEVKPQPERGLDDYLAWLEDTPSDLLPPGEDVSDLGMLGRTLYEQVDRDEVARRVAVALQRGRSWHEVLGFRLEVEDEGLQSDRACRSSIRGSHSRHGVGRDRSSGVTARATPSA